MTRSIPLATTLSPFLKRYVGEEECEIGHLYQHRCIRSWRENGFDIFSVNAPSEVDLVKAAFPDVEIVVAERDMAAFCGKPLIPLAEMIRALRATGASHGGIVNADVYAADTNVGARMEFDGRHALMFASRYEVEHPFGRPRILYNNGFDAFFFDIATASTLTCDPFTIGLPWWDYMFPLAFMMEGHAAAWIDGFPLHHLTHRAGWDFDNWRYFHDTFLHRFSPGFAELGRSNRAEQLPALDGIAATAALGRRYIAYAESRGLALDTKSVAHRYQTAYSVAVVDLIMEMAGTRHFDPLRR